MSPMAKHKSNSGTGPLWGLFLPEKETKAAGAAICVAFRVAKSLAWWLQGTLWEEWPLFSRWHSVASGWGGGKAFLFSAGSQSMTFSPFPVTQDPTRAPLTWFGTEVEQGWAKSSPSNERRKGVYANAWALVGISSLRGSH